MRRAGAALVVLALVVILVGLGGYAVRRLASAPGEAPPAEAAASTSVGRGSTADVTRLPVFQPTAPPEASHPSLLDAMDVVLEKRAGAGADPGPGRKYMERYQGRSGRLNQSDAPMVLGHERSPAAVDPSLELWVTPSPAEANSPVTIRARLTAADGTPVTPTTVSARVTSDRDARLVFSGPLTAAPGAPGELAVTMVPAASLMTRDPQGGTVPVPTTLSVQVVAEGTHAGEPFRRLLTATVFLQQLQARIVAETLAVDRNDEGVVLRFKVDARRSGTYFAQAELWSSGAESRPIAFGRRRVQLSEGVGQIELLFGGMIIRDRGVDGPFVIKQLNLMQVDTIPPHQAPRIALVKDTPPWPASSFQ